MNDELKLRFARTPSEPTLSTKNLVLLAKDKHTSFYLQASEQGIAVVLSVTNNVIDSVMPATKVLKDLAKREEKWAVTLVTNLKKELKWQNPKKMS